MDQFFGLESFVKLEKPNIKSSNDVAVVVVHWSLASQGVLCVGVGDTFQTGDQGSEILPDRWNEDGSVYSLKYLNKKDEKFLLKVITVDSMLIISLLALKTESNSDLSITAADFIKTDGEISFSNLEELVNKIKVELVEKVVQPKGKAEKLGGKSCDEEQERKTAGHDPLLVGGRGGRGRVDPSMPGWGGVGAPPLGGSDLDPMGGIMGGGMLMDPRQGGRLGQPMQPRFDPVGPGMGGIGPLGGGGMGGMGPLGGGGRGRNYGDAMRPPSWDNMFM